MLHVYAALAQEERRLISTRTKEALAAAEARGKQLGSTGKILAAKNAAAAAARDQDLRPILQSMAGQSSRVSICAAAHEQPIRTSLVLASGLFQYAVRA